MFAFFKPKKNYENLSATAFNQLLNEMPNAVLIDVRTPQEFRQGAIENAINIDLMSNDFSQKIAKLPKDKAYFVYCRSGNRSGSACKHLGNNGFEQVYNLSGGIMSWSF